MYTDRPSGKHSFYFATPENAKETIQTLANARNYPAMIPLLKKNLGTYLTINDVRSISQRMHSETLQNAFSSYDKILMLGYTGLSDPETFILCLYIEAVVKRGVYVESYFKKELYNIPRTIERDMNGNIFIHLKTHNIAPVGKGFWKNATNSIAYDLEKPSLITTTASDMNEQYEISVLDEFKGVTGVLQIKGYNEHKKARTKERRLHIMTEYLPQRSIHDVIASNAPLSLKQIVEISRCALKGVRNMHRKGYVHRDLHTGNIFIDLRESKAVIGDLGQAKKISEATKGVCQLVPSYRAPEGLSSEKHEHVDYCKTDAYALGLVLYQIFHKKKPSWMDKVDYDTLEQNPVKVAQLVTKEIKNFTETNGKSLSKRCKKNDATPSERYEKILLKMLREDPNKRPTVGHSLWELSNLKKAIF